MAESWSPKTARRSLPVLWDLLVVFAFVLPNLDALTGGVAGIPVILGCIVVAVLLFWRRRYPVPVLAGVSVVVVVVTAVAGIPWGTELGIILASYAVASWRKTWVALISVAGSCAVVIAGLALWGDPASLGRGLAFSVTNSPFEAQDARVNVGIAVVVLSFLALVVGNSMRNHRLLAESLHVQARQAADLAKQAADLESLLGEHQDLLNNVPVGVFRMHLDSGTGDPVLDFANSRVAQQLNLSPDGMTADQMFATIHPEDRSGLIAAIGVSMSTAEPFNWEGRTTGVGATKWLKMQGVVTSSDTDGRRLEGFQQDITERKWYEDQLRSDRQAAQQAATNRARFLSEMSHELRTPLSGTIGFLELLKESGLDAQQQYFADRAEKSGVALARLVDDVLDYARIDAGRMPLHIAEFEIAPMLDDVAALIAAGLGASKDLQVITDIDPTIPKVLLGDGARLRQVLLNLAGNAAKFTEKGEIRIAVKPVSASTSQLRLAFSVRDTGIGMTSDQITRIFDEFSQAESDTSLRHGGSGLGLTISRKLVNLMGGELAVESAPGVGSTFSFELPFDLPDRN